MRSRSRRPQPGPDQRQFVRHLHTQSCGRSDQKIVSQPGFDTNPEWSPDSRQLVFSTAMGRDLSFAKISRLAMVSAEGGTPRSLTDGFDEVPSVVGWNNRAVFLGAAEDRRTPVPDQPGLGPDRARLGARRSDGRRLHDRPRGPSRGLYRGATKTMSELYVSDINGFAPRALTDMTAQAADFIVGSRELIPGRARTAR